MKTRFQLVGPAIAAGLSHMAEGLHEEGVVPPGTLDLASDRGTIGEARRMLRAFRAKDGKSFGSIVLSCAAGVLGEINVEHPMELVLGGPVE